MTFRDKIVFYEPKNDRYKQEPDPDFAKSTATVANISVNSGITRKSFFDQFSGDAHMYISSNDSYVIENSYDLAGKFVSFENVLYRVENSAQGNHKLTSNRRSFVECSLVKSDFAVPEANNG